MQQLGIKRPSEILHQSNARKKPSKNRKENDQLCESTELEVPTLLLQNMLAILNDICMYL
jgi:hypothetical protein